MAMHVRHFHALVKVNGYKRPFELGDFQCRGGLGLAREIVQEQFQAMVDPLLYPKLPYNHIPSRSDIKIVWHNSNGAPHV